MKAAAFALFPSLLMLATMGAERGPAAPGAMVRVERQVFLMGTVATLVTYASAREPGLATLERIVELLEATEAELSTWRPDSAISRLNRTPIGTVQVVASPLCELLSELKVWHGYTQGLFDPAIGRLLEVWDIHGAGRRATPDEVAAARARSGFRYIRVDPAACHVVRQADVTLDTGGFGKGAALDRVQVALGGSSPTLVDLGGQVMTYGPPPNQPGWPIGLAHPRRRTVVAATVLLRTGSLSTSGGSERDREVDGVRIGHILDPLSGRPVSHEWSVVVWHPRALAADILSTALYLMGPRAGLAWAEQRGLAVCFLVPDRRDPHRSVTFRMTSAFRATLGSPQRF